MDCPLYRILTRVVGEQRSLSRNTRTAPAQHSSHARRHCFEYVECSAHLQDSKDHSARALLHIPAESGAAAAAMTAARASNGLSLNRCAWSACSPACVCDGRRNADVRKHMRCGASGVPVGAAGCSGGQRAPAVVTSPCARDLRGQHVQFGQAQQSAPVSHA